MKASEAVCSTILRMHSFINGASRIASVVPLQWRQRVVGFHIRKS